MALALRLHLLRDGELPLYPITCPNFFVFTMNERDPPASTWVQQRAWSRSRACLPLNLEITYQYFEGLLRDWLLDLGSVCPGGTLIFSLRTSTVIEPLGLWVLAGMGCVPEGPVEGAFDLQGADPEDLILQICRLEGGANLDGMHPAIRGMFGHLIANRELREQSLGRSRRLLESFLSPKQREELDASKAFHVQGQNGQLYCIRERHAHNIELIEDGVPKIRYCIISKDRVPLYDQMLGQKLLLERDVEAFLRIANYHVFVQEAPPPPV